MFRSKAAAIGRAGLRGARRHWVLITVPIVLLVIAAYVLAFMLDEPLGVASTAHVGQQGDDVTAGRGDLGLRLFKRVLIAHRGQRQPRAFTGTGSEISLRAWGRSTRTTGLMISTSATSRPDRSARQWTLALRRSTSRTGGSGCSSCVIVTCRRSRENPNGWKSSLLMFAV